MTLGGQPNVSFLPRAPKQAKFEVEKKPWTDFLFLSPEHGPQDQIIVWLNISYPTLRVIRTETWSSQAGLNGGRYLFNSKIRKPIY
jgi:hypothetical protein